MRIGFCAALAAALLLSGPAMAKPAHQGHDVKAQHAKTRHAQADRRYAQSHYDYRSASVVREEFRDAPYGHWMRTSQARRFGGYAVEEQQGGQVVENLRGDFTGGVGYGADGGAFVDGYGQTHFFVGSFRAMNPLPHGPYRPGRPPGRAF